MTHEELLAEIDDCIYKYGLARHKTGMFFALRAVVELHKPNCFGQCDECALLCWGCEEWGCDTNCDCDCHPNYPCPTIQAIEPELG